MRSQCLIAAALLLTACDDRDASSDEAAPATRETPAPRAPAVKRPLARWDLQPRAEGTALQFLSASGAPAMELFCPAAERLLLVNVPGFRPIGSEERLTFGSGSEVTTVAADPRGDSKRGGVTGSGEIPANLAALVGGRVSANYGAQNSGPHPVPPKRLVRDFVAACRKPSAAAVPSGSTADACLVQDGERLDVAPIRAIGTEPFWGARIEGRCVTYSHPEDQQGTRIWTRFASGPEGDSWSGALAGRKFELRTRTAPGCSDGMSDRRYPLAVELLVGGERRKGCAESLAAR